MPHSVRTDGLQFSAVCLSGWSMALRLPLISLLSDVAATCVRSVNTGRCDAFDVLEYNWEGNTV